MLPARRQRPRSGIDRGGPERCPGHLSWVRTHGWSVPGCGDGPIESAHVRVGTDGSMGEKPSDCWTVSLCRDHHAEQHRIGEPAFERHHHLHLRMLALEFAAKSPAWQRHLTKKRERDL